MKEARDYKKLCHQLVSQWQAENVPLNAGATEQELSVVENTIGLRLPLDFRYFYSLVNGMRDHESDKRFFSLWPISRMIEENEGIVVDRTSMPPRIEIAFGDFMIDSHRFHLKSDEHGKFYVTAEIIEGENLADEFAQFLELYLCGSERLGLF